MCEGGKEADECSVDDPCTPGSHFCDYSTDEDIARNIPGICKACPHDLSECFEDGFVTSKQSKLNCHYCRMTCYTAVGNATLTIANEDFIVISDESIIQKSSQDVSGPLIDCTDLLLVNKFLCPGAEDHVCFFDASGMSPDESRTLRDLYQVAKSNGCIAMVVYNTRFGIDYEMLTIPFVTLSERGNLQGMLEEGSRVQVQTVGTVCVASSIDTDCTNSGLNCGDNEYCGFSHISKQYTEGTCTKCPTFENGEPDPSGCFWDTRIPEEYGRIVYSPDRIKSCAISCEASFGKLVLLVFIFTGNVILMSACSSSICLQPTGSPNLAPLKLKSLTLAWTTKRIR